MIQGQDLCFSTNLLKSSKDFFSSKYCASSAVWAFWASATASAALRLQLSISRLQRSISRLPRSISSSFSLSCCCIALISALSSKGWQAICHYQPKHEHPVYLNNEILKGQPFWILALMQNSEGTVTSSFPANLTLQPSGCKALYFSCSGTRAAATASFRRTSQLSVCTCPAQHASEVPCCFKEASSFHQQVDFFLVASPPWTYQLLGVIRSPKKVTIKIYQKWLKTTNQWTIEQVSRIILDQISHLYLSSCHWWRWWWAERW